MAIKIEQNIPRARSNRFSLGLSLKSQVSHRRATDKRNEDGSDEWYIPYNGPIEKPRVSPELRPRDSWGDLINTYGVDGGVLRDSDLNSRYDARRGDVHLDGSDSDHEKAVGRRNRVLSGVSYRTTSSVAIGSAIPRRATISRTGAQPFSSYSTPDVGGGVGESPMPPQRLAHLVQNATNSHRVSLTSLFSFSGSSKKSRSPSSHASPVHVPDARSSPPKSFSSLLRSNSQPEGKKDHPKTRGRREKASAAKPLNVNLPKTTDEAYYDSYYSSLITTPKANDQTPTSTRPLDIDNQRYRPSARDTHNGTNSHAFPSQPAHQLVPHPYAHVSPSTDRSEGLSTGRSATVNHDTKQHGQSHHQKPVASTHPMVPAPRAGGHRQQLRSSVSSPDLYAAARLVGSLQGQNAKAKQSSKDRWLAIETWCDAIVFPRPRFYVQQGGKEKRLMIITPPDTPIAGPITYLGDQNQEKRPPSRTALPVLQSRVLLHSKSHSDLRHTNIDPGSSSLPLMTRRRGATLPNGSARQYPFHTETSDYTGLEFGRRRSSIQGDARSASPVPSLTKVLEEGQQLNEMRQKWQTQATQSFQNKRTRSISRTRSKSLNSGNPRNGRKESDSNKVVESFDYLATRTFLGNQSVMPTVHPCKPIHRSPEKSFGTGTTSSKSHSHSSSLIKSSSKSSKASVQRGHSRNESWGQSALKYAKSTAVSLCGLSDSSLSSPPDEDMAKHDGALKRDARAAIVPSDSDTKPLLPPNARANPLTSEPTYDPPPNVWGESPAPSGSFEAVGIALSTPPPFDERCTPSYEDDPISLPDHPYGQGSLTQHVQTTPAVSHRLRDSWRGSDYAGPHPAIATMVVQGDINDFSARHRLPPQVVLHPYAQATASGHHAIEDAMTAYVRSDSQIPPGERMWAQLSPSKIQEILPSDIVYSPFETTPVETKPPEQVRKTRSTVSVGEALSSTLRTRDSGLGTNEGHDMFPIITTLKQSKDESETKDMGEQEKSSTAPLRVGRFRHPYGTAMLDPTKLPPTQSDLLLDSSLLEAGHSSGSSPGVHSQSSSPQMSPRPLGSMDDLDHFRDLFYRPSTLLGDSSGPGTPGLPWEIRSHRTGSGLTSLARQLSVELEELNARFDPSEGVPLGSAPDGMQFILSEARGSSSSRDMGQSLHLTLDRDRLAVFRPSFSVPEDVDDSSRSSSVLQRSPAEDDSDTGPIRVGTMESIVTPVTTATPRPLSGHLSLVDEDVDVADVEDTTVRLRDPKPQQHQQREQTSSLAIPVSAEATRSSYMTTSTNGSRMSGLSDFPIPPGDLPAHMRLIESYLAAGSGDVPPPSHGTPEPPVSRRMTFGGEEDIEDIAKALSAP